MVHGLSSLVSNRHGVLALFCLVLVLTSTFYSDFYSVISSSIPVQSSVDNLQHESVNVVDFIAPLSNHGNMFTDALKFLWYKISGFLGVFDARKPVFQPNPGTVNITFIASGLRYPLPWYVYVDQPPVYSSINATNEHYGDGPLTFAVSQGQHNYTVEAPMGYTYTLTQLNSTLYSVVFTQGVTYNTLTIKEVGLPNSTSWGVSIDYGPQLNTTSNSISIKLVDGLHTLSVLTPNGYTPDTSIESGGASSFGVLLEKGNLTLTLNFTQYMADIVLSERNLPSGTPWWVEVNGLNSSASAPQSISIPVPITLVTASAGSTSVKPSTELTLYFAFAFGAPAPWESGANYRLITVNPANNNHNYYVGINFSSDTVLVRFVESGLPPGQTWSLSLYQNATLHLSTSRQALTVYILKGSYYFFTVTTNLSDYSLRYVFVNGRQLSNSASYFNQSTTVNLVFVKDLSVYLPSISAKGCEPSIQGWNTIDQPTYQPTQMVYDPASRVLYVACANSIVAVNPNSTAPRFQDVFHISSYNIREMLYNPFDQSVYVILTNGFVLQIKGGSIIRYFELPFNPGFAGIDPKKDSLIIGGQSTVYEPSWSGILLDLSDVNLITGDVEWIRVNLTYNIVNYNSLYIDDVRNVFYLSFSGQYEYVGVTNVVMFNESTAGLLSNVSLNGYFPAVTGNPSTGDVYTVGCAGSDFLNANWSIILLNKTGIADQVNFGRVRYVGYPLGVASCETTAIFDNRVMVALPYVHDVYEFNPNLGSYSVVYTPDYPVYMTSDPSTGNVYVEVGLEGIIVLNQAGSPGLFIYMSGAPSALAYDQATGDIYAGDGYRSVIWVVNSSNQSLERIVNLNLTMMGTIKLVLDKTDKTLYAMLSNYTFTSIYANLTTELVALNLTDLRIEWIKTIPIPSYPEDFLVNSNVLYALTSIPYYSLINNYNNVSRYDHSLLWVVDARTGSILKSITLNGIYDDLYQPQVAQLLAIDPQTGELYVGLNTIFYKYSLTDYNMTIYSIDPNNYTVNVVQVISNTYLDGLVFNNMTKQLVVDAASGNYTYSCAVYTHFVYVVNPQTRAYLRVSPFNPGVCFAGPLESAGIPMVSYSKYVIIYNIVLDLTQLSFEPMGVIGQEPSSTFGLTYVPSYNLTVGTYQPYLYPYVEQLFFAYSSLPSFANHALSYLSINVSDTYGRPLPGILFKVVSEGRIYVLLSSQSGSTLSLALPQGSVASIYECIDSVCLFLSNLKLNAGLNVYHVTLQTLSVGVSYQREPFSGASIEVNTSSGVFTIPTGLNGLAVAYLPYNTNVGVAACVDLVCTNQSSVTLTRGVNTLSYTLGSFSAKVVAQSGSPVTGAGVVFLSRGSPASVEMYTDSSGFSPGILAPVNSTITVAVYTSGTGLPYLPAQGVFVVSSNHTVGIITLKGYPEGVVTGSVVDANGTSITGLRVYFEGYLNGRPIQYSALTNSTGGFSLVLYNGSYGVYLLPPAISYGLNNAFALDSAVNVYPNRTSSVRIVFPAVVPALIRLELFVQYLGGNLFGPIPVDWRTAVHFDVYARDPSGNNYFVPGAINSTSGQNIENIIPVVGYPGEPFQVCADGYLAQLPSTCVTVRLSSNLSATATLYLIQQSVVRATLVDALSGQPVTSWYATVYPLSNTSYPLEVSNSSSSLDVGLGPGSYLFVVTSQSSTTQLMSRFTVSVPSAQIVNLGAVALYPEGEDFFAGKQGNYITSSPSLVVPGTTLFVRIAYNYTGSQTLSNVTLIIPMISGASLLQNSVLLNGRRVDASISGEYYLVPIGTLSGASQGVLRAELSLGTFYNATYLPLTAFMSYVDQSGAHTELLGSDSIDVSQVSIQAPLAVDTSSISVTGEAPPNSLVWVYDNSSLLGEVVSGGGGFWSLNAQLSVSRGVSLHVLHAQAHIGNITLDSHSLFVFYNPNYPRINLFCMQQADGRRICTDPSLGPLDVPYVFVPGMPLQLTVGFTNTSLVSNVVIYVQNVGYVNATLGDDGLFHATITTTQVPGSISVSYDTLNVPMGNGQIMPAVDSYMSSLRNTLLASSKIHILNLNSSFFEAILNLPNNTGVIPNNISLLTIQTLHVRKDVFYTPTLQDIQVLTTTGYPVFNYSSNIVFMNSTMIVVNYSLFIPYSALPPNVTSQFDSLKDWFNNWGSSIPGIIATGKDIVEFVGKNAAEISEHTSIPVVGVLTNALGAASDYSWYKEIESRMSLWQACIQGIKNPNYNTTYAENLYNGLQTGIKKIFIRAEVNDGAGFAVSFAGSIPAAFIYALPLELAGTGYGIYIVYKENKLSSEVDFQLNKCNSELNAVANPKIVIDPSGYVYEAIPSNPLPNVSATIYYRPNSSMPWSVWNAAAFGETSQEYTDARGAYGWFVPQGQWMVVYQKQGYFTVQSPVLNIPPPVVGLNISMVSYLPPVVDGLFATRGGVLIDFSKYMVSQSLNNQTVTLTDSSGGAIPGNVLIVNSSISPTGLNLTRNVVFVPKEPLSVGSTYTLHVSNATFDYAFVHLGSSFSRVVEVQAGPNYTLSVTPRVVFSGSTVNLSVETNNGAVSTVKFEVYSPSGGLVYSNTVGTSSGVATSSFIPDIGGIWRVGAVFMVGGSAYYASYSNVTVLTQPAFLISAGPPVANLTQGGSVTEIVRLDVLTPLGSPISIGVSGLPQGVSYTLNQTSCTSSCVVSLSLSASQGAQTGQSFVNVSASSLGLRAYSSVLLNVLASQSVTPPQYYSVTFIEQGLPLGSSWSVTIGGERYTSSGGSITVALPAGSYSYQVTPIVSVSEDTRYVTPNSNGDVRLPGDTRIVVSYYAQYYLTIDSNPPGVGFVNQSSGWFNNDSVLTLSATPEQGYIFSGWSTTSTGIIVLNATSAVTKVVILGPGTLIAQFSRVTSTTTTTTSSSTTLPTTSSSTTVTSSSTSTGTASSTASSTSTSTLSTSSQTTTSKTRTPPSFPPIIIALGALIIVALISVLVLRRRR